MTLRVSVAFAFRLLRCCRGFCCTASAVGALCVALVFTLTASLTTPLASPLATSLASPLASSLTSSLAASLSTALTRSTVTYHLSLPTRLTRGIITCHLNVRTFPSPTSECSTLSWPHRRRRTITPLRGPPSLSPSDGRPFRFLSRDPITGRCDGGDGLGVGDLHTVLVGLPTFAWVRLLVVSPLLAGGVDTPHEVVGERRLAPPVVLVGRLGEAVGPLRS